MTANFDIYNRRKFQTRQFSFSNYVELARNHMLHWYSADQIELQDPKLLIMYVNSTKFVDSEEILGEFCHADFGNTYR